MQDLRCTMETLRGLGWEKEVVFVLNHRGHREKQRKAE